MKICGVIAEYNPFHNGHIYMLQEIRKSFDGIAAVMSGNFVQRGEPACADKWTRAKWAMDGGVDLIIELPVVYAVNTAERFAFGAVSLLDGLGCIDGICFGSEAGEIQPILAAAEMLEQEPAEVSGRLQEALRSGESFPAARQKAWDGLIDGTLLSQPNNILAIEYIRALIRLKSTIKPMTIPRLHAGYHDREGRGGIASASGIRDMLRRNVDYSQYTPVGKLPAINTAPLDMIFIGELRRRGIRCFEEIPDVCEGLGDRFLKAAGKTADVGELLTLVHTKRYPKTRLSRIVINTILGNQRMLSQKPVQYARVLAANETGRRILRQIKNTGAVEVVTKTADYTKLHTDPVFQKDILATDIYALCVPGDRLPGWDYRKSPVVE